MYETLFNIMLCTVLNLSTTTIGICTQNLKTLRVF